MNSLMTGLAFSVSVFNEKKVTGLKIEIVLIAKNEGVGLSGSFAL
jgi:hypothetical protein